ncbi:nucleotide sugar dehydrogenase [Patescibacteria group bacterium]|nr:nucleotide sugar dehydrogenase [Patescibacteria group bacterium]
MPKSDIKIAVVGLGYVGLPLAVEFGLTKLAPVVGFDINQEKIAELKQGIESMGEVDRKKFKKADINYTDKASDIKQANFIIVAIPTPITKANKPDLTPIIKATETIGENISKNSIVVYESTVYPGVTEDICVPILEKQSGLKNLTDFKVGYSPERINPGDKEHTVDKIIKVVSGQDKKSLTIISQVYRTICKNGICQASNIKTAEASKVIENTQRDLNIAFINELALIFNKMGLNTTEVIKAAATKWNFHEYQPGLVGGHCIGVDPYYLTHKAQELGYHPEVILAGRKINDAMAEKISEMVVKELFKQGKSTKNTKVLIMGVTFKEDVNDRRNSKVEDVIKTFQNYNLNIDIHDPMFKHGEKLFGLTNNLKLSDKYDVIFIGAYHDKFKKYKLNNFKKICKKEATIVDIKSHFKKGMFKGTGFTHFII